MNTNYSHCIEGGNVEMRKPVEFGRPCAVYRHYDAAGALLYVGCSTDPAARLYSHFKESAWAKLIASVTFEWFDDRADAIRAESDAIHEGRPRFNKARNPVAEAGTIQASYSDKVAEMERHLHEAGLSLDDFLCDAKVHRTTWGRWRRGEFMPRLQQWNRIMGSYDAITLRGAA